MKTIYDSSIPVALLPIVTERISSIEHLLPGWCQQLVITYSSDNNEGYTLSCSPEYNYRFVQFQIFDLFFKDEHWESSLLHEIMHAICAPYSTQAWQLLDVLQVDADVKEYIGHQIRGAEEALAQDMSKFATDLTILQ